MDTGAAFSKSGGSEDAVFAAGGMTETAVSVPAAAGAASAAGEYAAQPAKTSAAHMSGITNE